MTCYLNSLLQTLFMTPEFRNAIYRLVCVTCLPVSWPSKWYKCQYLQWHGLCDMIDTEFRMFCINWGLLRNTKNVLISCKLNWVMKSSCWWFPHDKEWRMISQHLVLFNKFLWCVDLAIDQCGFMTCFADGSLQEVKMKQERAFLINSRSCSFFYRLFLYISFSSKRWSTQNASSRHTSCTTWSTWNPTLVQAYNNSYWYWSQSLFVVNSVKFHLMSLILFIFNTTSVY